jgi:hypothetical protein
VFELIADQATALKEAEEREEGLAEENISLFTALEVAAAALKGAQADIATLWMLLDDIDTLDDAAKDSDKSFRDACYKIQQKRWKIKDPFSKDKQALSKE